MGVEQSTDALPDELLVQVLSLLSGVDLAAASGVNRHLRRVSSTDLLWRRLVSVDFSAYIVPANSPLDNRELYRHLAVNYKPGRRALNGKFFAFRGEWRGFDRYRFGFDLILAPHDLGPGAGRCGGDGSIGVCGRLNWTLTGVPGHRSFLRSRLGDHASELLVGIYNPAARLLLVSGYQKLETQINGVGLIACDEYRITLASDGLSFKGVTRGNEFEWNNNIEGDYEQSLDLYGQALSPDEPRPVLLPEFDFLNS